jgi:hypothetical protein
MGGRVSGVILAKLYRFEFPRSLRALPRLKPAVWVRLGLALLVWVLPMSVRNMGGGASQVAPGLAAGGKTVSRPLHAVLFNPSSMSRLDEAAFKAPAQPKPVAVPAPAPFICSIPRPAPGTGSRVCGADSGPSDHLVRSLRI